jgi:hypothetical protein
MSTITLVMDNDDYDFGISKDGNRGVKFIVTETGNSIIEKNEVLNPFFVELSGGSLNDIEQKDVYSNYSKAFIMCMKNTYSNTNDAYEIYERVLKNENIDKLKSYFSLIETSINITKINSHRNKGLIITKANLELFFNGIQFENTEIIIPMFEMKESFAKIYASLFEKHPSIKTVGTILELTNFYTKSYKKPIEEQLKEFLLHLKESQYWTVKGQLTNITNEWKTRSFRDDEIHDGHKHIPSENSLKTRLQNMGTTILSSANLKEKDYLNFINEKKGFVDNYSALVKDGVKRTYFALRDDESLIISKDEITYLFSRLTNESELYHLFNALLVSKDYCHMVLNNLPVLDKMTPLFNKYKILYKYLFSYAWTCFNMEENIFKTKTKKEYRFVMDINTANKLPVFPMCSEDILQNPYITLLLDQKELNSSKNLLSLGYMGDHDGYGVCNLEQFKWRFNLFTTGDPTKNIFDGIDWSSFAVSGSVMPACLQKKSPLMRAFDEMSETDMWEVFFNSYYKDSDIDLMCNDLSVFGFIDKTRKVFDQIKANIPNCTDKDVEFEPIKTLGISITEHFLKERLQHFNEDQVLTWTADDFLKNLDVTRQRQYFYAEYTDVKRKMNHRLRLANNYDLNNEFAKSFLEMSSPNDLSIHYVTYNYTKNDNYTLLDSDNSFYINDFRGPDNQVPDNQNFLVMKISENIKFKIRSSKMKRPVELFRAKSTDFFGVVGRFHLPCVRAYYQGNNVFIMPSCITAMMTGLNLEYKYFAGIRDPVEILNKYLTRGFGVILNQTELKHYVDYNKNSKSKMYSCYDDKDGSKLIGSHTLDDAIYKPLVYNEGYPEETYKKVGCQYILTIQDLRKYYKEKLGYDSTNSVLDMFNVKTHEANGDMKPYEPSIIELFYKLMNN